MMSVETKMRLELTFLTTYVHGDGTLFRKGQVYEMSDEKGTELLSQRDEAGSPYFKRWKARPPKPPVDPNGPPEGVVTIPDDMKTGDGVGVPKGRVVFKKRSDKLLGPDGDTASGVQEADEDDNNAVTV